MRLEQLQIRILTCIFLLCGSAALIFSRYTVDNFNVPKLPLIITAGCIAIIASVLLIATNALKRPKSVYLSTIPFLIFFCSFLFSWLFGPASLAKGFFGSQGRLNGFALYGSLSLVAVCIVLMYVEKIDKIFENIFVITIFLEAFYCFLQFIGRDPVNWDFSNIGATSILGTFGNPNFVSSFMSVSSIFLLLRSLSISAMPVRVAYQALGIFSMFLVWKTGSLQGIMLILIGISLASLFFLTGKFDRIRKIFYPLVSIGLVVAVIVGFTLSGQIPNLQKFSVNTFIYRLEYMKVGLKMFLDNPLFGVGIDSFGEHFREYRSFENFIKVPYVLVDNPHNLAISLAACSGVFVFVGYLILNLYVLTRILKFFKEINRVDFGFISLTVAWMMFVVQSFISIDNAGLAPWPWILGAILVSTMNLELEKQEKKTLFTVKKSNPSRRGDSLVIVTWIILGFGFASLIFGWNKIVGTNRELKSLRVYASSNPGVPNSKIGESYVRDLYNFYSYDSAYSRVLATDAFAIGLNTVGDEISRDTLNRFPRIFEVLNLRAKILEVTQRSDKATSLRKSALEVEPIFQESYLDYASNLLLNGKKDEAIQILNQGLKSSYETDRIKNLLKAIVTNPEVGNEVQHNLYGKGKVVSISDKSITVKFYNEGIGTMTFERERAPLAYVR